MYKSIISERIDALIEKLKEIKENSSNITGLDVISTPEEYEFSFGSGAIGQYDTIITFHHVNNYSKKEAEKIMNIFL